MARSTKRKRKATKKSDAEAWKELNRSFGRLARESTTRRHDVLSGAARPEPAFDGDYPTSTITKEEFWRRDDLL